MKTMDGNVKKVFQKRFYDLLSHKYGILIIFAGAILLTVSAFHFGEAWLEWSKEKYEAVFNSFSDNIVGKSFRERLSLPVPIDVVYTWVNGSDPAMIEQLEALKMAEASKSNVTKEEKCTYTNCLPVGVVVFPPLPATVSVKDLAAVDEKFANVTSITNLPEGPAVSANLSFLALTVEASVAHLVKKFHGGLTFQGHNFTIKPAFYTSDGQLTHGVDVPYLALLSGYPRQYTIEEMQKTVATRMKIADKADSLEVKLFIEKGLALVHTTDKAVLSSLLKDSNFTLENKVLGISSVRLVWDLKVASHVDEIADYRFQDKEELRYSLRSVEQYAPWVRHIYIVTNGQIPHWLNLDHPRITVVSHEEIFANASHLPTFSSPAIEANIHRIPGLSKKFLYLNDDVMFGQPVWPDDFYSHSTGQKLYLSWPVPNCNEGCPSNWINDGYCDKSCNTSECEWDGDDCKGKGGHVQFGAGFHGGQGNPYGLGEVAYCQTGCANNWLADRYCDQACNNFACGFDAGDCGVDNFDKLYGLQFAPDQKMYDIPPGETMIYLNMTQVMEKHGKVTAATFGENKAIRTAAVGNKYKVLVLLLNKGHNYTSTSFFLNFKLNENVTSQINFTIMYDTSVDKKVVEKKVVVANETGGPHPPSDDELDAKAFMEGQQNRKKPVALEVKESPLESGLDVNLVDALKHFHKLNVSKDLRKKLEVLHAESLQGFYTEKGLRKELHSVYALHKTELNSLRERLEIVKRETVLNESAANQQKKMEEVKMKVEPDDKEKDLGVGNQGVRPNQDFAESIKEKHESKLVGVSRNGRVLKPVANNVLPRDTQNDAVHQVNPNGENRLGPREANPPVPPQNVPGDVQQNGQAPRVPGDQVAGRKLLAVASKTALFQRLLGYKAKIARGDNQRPKKQRAGKTMLDQNQEIFEQDFIRLVSAGHSDKFVHHLPWEKPLRGEGALRVEKEPKEVAQEEDGEGREYDLKGWHGRHLLDAFGDSLRHVNRIYNKVFGFTSRKVPAHMPHMIDKEIMQELQDRFPEEWDATSSHKIRHSKDMQYAFAYFYYIMGVTEEMTQLTVFNAMDTDKSNILSDREIRTFAAKAYDLPLYLETLTGLEQMFINCSKHFTDPTVEALTEDQKEVYYEKTMPQVTRHLFIHCDAIIKLVSEKFKHTLKYKTSIMDDSDVSFKIIHSNVSLVVGQLDDVRKNPKKFICLNDNMEHNIEEAATVKAVLQDFYESILPIPSQFELPREYRNRFLHVNELRQWRRYRDWLKFWTHAALVLLVLMTISSFLGDKLENLKKKFLRRKRHKSLLSPSSPSSSSPSSILARQSSLETV